MKKLKERIQGIVCRLSHDIEVVSNCIFVDQVSGVPVGEFICSKCKINYMAHSKRAIHRVMIPDGFRSDK